MLKRIMTGPDLTSVDAAKTTFEAERDGILETFKCLVDGVDVLYCSTPITGGRRFLKWYSGHGRFLDQADRSYVDELRAEVIGPNCEAGQVLSGALRRETQQIVIDPTRFFLSHWSQPDYHELWCEVIRRFVSAVHFADGWWLSVGCALEFATAIEHDVPTYEGWDSPLSAVAGYILLQDGALDLDNIGVPSDTLRGVAERVGSHIPQGKER